MTVILEDPKVRQLIVHSAAWRLLGLCFETPSTERRTHMIAILGEGVETALARAARATLEVSQGEYQALFGPGGAVSPREVAYSPRSDPGQILADLRGFYQAFAYQTPLPEPPDHLAIESGFLGFLTLKSAFAQANHDENALQITSDARQKFLRDHFGPFASQFSQRLLALPDHPFLPLARFLERQGNWQEVELG